MTNKENAVHWEHIREGLIPHLFEVAQTMKDAWGQRPGMIGYIDRVYHGAYTLGYPAEFEMLIKRESGVGSVHKGFWHSARTQQSTTLAETVMTALRQLDLHTQDFDARMQLRRSYFAELLSVLKGIQALEQ